MVFVIEYMIENPTTIIDHVIEKLKAVWCSDVLVKIYVKSVHYCICYRNNPINKNKKNYMKQHKVWMS